MLTCIWQGTEAVTRTSPWQYGVEKNVRSQKAKNRHELYA